MNKPKLRPNSKSTSPGIRFFGIPNPADFTTPTRSYSIRLTSQAVDLIAALSARIGARLQPLPPPTRSKILMMGVAALAREESMSVPPEFDTGSAFSYVSRLDGDSQHGRVVSTESSMGEIVRTAVEGFYKEAELLARRTGISPADYELQWWDEFEDNTYRICGRFVRGHDKRENEE